MSLAQGTKRSVAEPPHDGSTRHPKRSRARTGALIWNTTQKPDPLENRAFAAENITTDDSVIISPVRGGYRESNPDRRYHKPQC